MTDTDTIGTYESVVEEYRERHGDRSGIQELVEEFCDALDDATSGDASRVADIGCGPGWESATFAERGHEVVGVDLTPAFLEVARTEAPAASFARMDMRQLALAENTIDGLWACASFLHVPREDAAETLAGFRRVVRPGGVVYLSVARGDGETEGESYDEDTRQFTLYQSDQLRVMAEDVGLRVESVSDGDWIQLLARV
ncbi:class I SAM-dependent methyltransferase [Halorussus halophilus]|uniref:class I SAM-dependent methyltransferase n=1 Tax=Halorussus halophilus TaxID=2650975 RepID=UPI001300EC61|nr:class I SAM-dependent methyltransferase [Halorussus halophilus]